MFINVKERIAGKTVNEANREKMCTLFLSGNKLYRAVINLRRGAF
jgi:hypothetical protein